MNPRALWGGGASMRLTVALTSLALLAFLATPAAALDVEPDAKLATQGLIPEGNCHHGVGVQCPYQDCHDTTDPRCRDAMCQLMIGYDCYLDLPVGT